MDLEKIIPQIALIEVFNNVSPYLDEARKAVAILCDISKAFDSVEHQLILKKDYCCLDLTITIG